MTIKTQFRWYQGADTPSRDGRYALLRFCRLFTRSSTTAGSASVEVSPRLPGSSSAILRRSSLGFSPPSARVFHSSQAHSIPVNIKLSSGGRPMRLHRRQIGLPILTLLLALSVGPGPSQGAKLFDLLDFSEAHQKEFWHQVDNYAVAVAMLNACRQPPALEERLMPIAEGCVTTGTIASIVQRYRERVAAEAGQWNCADPGIQFYIKKIQQKIELLVGSAKRACRYRSVHELLPF
jgi:hypothetical protein